MVKKRVTFQIDDVYLEMIDDFRKTSGLGFGLEIPSRSGILRYVINLGLARMGYSKTEGMDKSELKALRQALDLKEGEKMPRWTKRKREP